MSEELLYTSAPQGLEPGSRGFCTVIRTAGMPTRLAEQLETLSGYRHISASLSSETSQNPVNFSHLILTLSGRPHHVLSRIADAGLDYTGRSNKLAHHVALAPEELVPVGPAGVLAADRFCETTWDGRPRELSRGRQPAPSVAPTGHCEAWQAAAGDAGWAGVLAENALRDGGLPMSVIVPVDQPTLPLVVEANGLLPESRRWDVTFCTYFTRLPAGVDCQWRFLIDGTPEARAARRSSPADVIDLCRSLPVAPGGVLVEQARTGQQPVPESTVPRPQPGLSPKAAVPRSSTVEPAFDSSAPRITIQRQRPVMSRPASYQIDRSRSATIPEWRRPAVLAGIVVSVVLCVTVMVVWRNRHRSESVKRSDERRVADSGIVTPVTPERALSDDRSVDGRQLVELNNEPSKVDSVPAAIVQARPQASQQPSLQKPRNQPRPLDFIRQNRFVDLPLLNPGLGVADKRVHLLSLDVEPDKCELRLSGSERLLDRGWTLGLLSSRSAGVRRWDVRLTTKNIKSLGAGKRIGSFQLAEGELTFGWSPGVRGSKNEAVLRQSVLWIHVGKQREHVFLSRPKTIAAIPVDVVKFEIVHPVSLDPKILARREDLHYQVALESPYQTMNFSNGYHLPLGREMFRTVRPRFAVTGSIPIEVKLVLRKNQMKALELSVSLWAKQDGFAFAHGAAFLMQQPAWQPVSIGRIKQSQTHLRKTRQLQELKWTNQVLKGLNDISGRLRIHLRCYVFVDNVQVELLKTEGWGDLDQVNRRSPSQFPFTNRPGSFPQEPGK